MSFSQNVSVLETTIEDLFQIVREEVSLKELFSDKKKAAHNPETAMKKNLFHDKQIFFKVENGTFLEEKN